MKTKAPKEVKRKRRRKYAVKPKAPPGPPELVSPAYLSDPEMSDLKKARYAVMDMRSVNPQMRERIEMPKSTGLLDQTVAELMKSKEPAQQIEGCKLYCRVLRRDDENRQVDHAKEMALRTTVIEVEGSKRVGELQVELDGGKPAGGQRTVEEMLEHTQEMDARMDAAAERAFKKLSQANEKA